MTLSADTSVLRFDLHAPDMQGDTVRFSWTQSEPWGGYGAQAFHITWRGIDVATFDVAVFLDIFLAYMGKPMALAGRPVHLQSAIPIPRESADYWRAYHGAQQLTITPTTDDVPGSPWAGPLRPQVAPASHSIFFGGGKDSLSAYLMLRELDGPDATVLVHFDLPRHPGDMSAKRTIAYRERRILAPTERRLGAMIQRIETDYLAHFSATNRRGQPHVELYTAGALPAIIARGVSTVFFTNGRHAYHYTLDRDGNRKFNYPRSRPEYVDTQRQHYRRLLGLDLTLTTSSGLTENFSNFKLLAERYPEHLDLAVTCGFQQGSAFCGRCTKCALWVLLDLSHGARDRRIDHDAAIREFPRFAAILDRALTLAIASTGVDSPWDPVLTSRVDSPSWHRAAHLADPNRLRSEHARTTLSIIQAVWGNEPHADIAWMSRNAVTRLRSEVARRMAPIIAQHLPVVDTITGPLTLAGEPVVYQGWEEVMPLPEALYPWALSP